MKIENNTIHLEHGRIKIGTEVWWDGYTSYGIPHYFVAYENRDLHVYQHNSFGSLEEAFNWYNKVYKDMLGA